MINKIRSFKSLLTRGMKFTFIGIYITCPMSFHPMFHNQRLYICSRWALWIALIKWIFNSGFRYMYPSQMEKENWYSPSTSRELSYDNGAHNLDFGQSGLTSIQVNVLFWKYYIMLKQSYRWATKNDKNFWALRFKNNILHIHIYVMLINLYRIIKQQNPELLNWPWPSNSLVQWFLENEMSS